MKLGFIGTGVMGRAITEHLMNAGHEVTVYNRTKAKTDELVKKEPFGLKHLKMSLKIVRSSFRWLVIPKM